MIYLSAGHSNSDPGAVGFGRKEADLAVEMRNMVSFYLTELGRPHETDGKGTVNIPLAQTLKRTKAINAIEVEFHCNASTNANATGVETLQGAGNAALGALICKAIAGALKIKNRGAKPESSGQHARLGFVQAGGIIVELFFISNANDLAAWDARKWVAAKAVAEVIAGYDK